MQEEDKIPMWEKARRYLGEKYPLLDVNVSVITRDAICATALAAMKSKGDYRR